MNTKTFFTLALILPFGAGLVGIFLPDGMPTLTFLVAGVPYLVFALLLGCQVSRAKCKTKVLRVSILAPLLFLPLVALVVALVGGGQDAFRLSWVQLSSVLLSTSIVSLVFGYSYMLIAWGTWYLFRTVGVVHDELAPIRL